MRLTEVKLCFFFLTMSANWLRFIILHKEIDRFWKTTEHFFFSSNSKTLQFSQKQCNNNVQYKHSSSYRLFTCTLNCLCSHRWPLTRRWKKSTSRIEGASFLLVTGSRTGILDYFKILKKKTSHTKENKKTSVMCKCVKKLYLLTSQWSVFGWRPGSF